jgi:hypothetical protein
LSVTSAQPFVPRKRCALLVPKLVSFGISRAFEPHTSDPDAPFTSKRTRTDADPPETTAAKAGHTNAQYNLGVLLATLLDPPELVEACRWLTTAAKAGIDEAVEARSRL